VATSGASDPPQRTPRVTSLEAALIVLAGFFLAEWVALRAAGPGGPDAWPTWLAGSLGPPLVLLIGALVVASRCRPLVPGLSPPLRTLWWVGAGVCLGAAGGMLVAPTRPDDLAPLLGHSAQIAWALLWVGVCAPVIEELFFRGVLQASIAQALNAPLAVLLAAFAFGVSHLGLQPLWLWPLLGVVFGWLAAASRSLWPPVAAHIGWNLATVLSSFSPLLDREAATAGLIGAAVCATGAVLANRRGRSAP